MVVYHDHPVFGKREQHGDVQLDQGTIFPFVPMGSESLSSWEQWCLFSCHQYARDFAFRQVDNTP